MLPLVYAHYNISEMCRKRESLYTHPYVKLLLYVPKIMTQLLLESVKGVYAISITQERRLAPQKNEGTFTVRK